VICVFLWPKRIGRPARIRFGDIDRMAASIGGYGLMRSL
jgi:hypothetical protein